MPIKLVRVNSSQMGRLYGKLCQICQKPLEVRVDSLLVIKFSGGSRYAHPDCAVKKIWIDKSQIQKEYVLADNNPK